MTDTTEAPGKSSAAENSSEVGGRYANYVLFVLVIVYVFNFIDRQILTILAEDIKADLGISDAQLGFLYGTAFAVFYAVFGIPLGRLADVWSRTRLISIGLGFWSLMTAMSGFAKNFASLAAFRIGVGVGEASASPAANSLLSDYFPPERRATALAIYASGIYIGSGIGIFLGGLIVDNWNAAFPDPSLAPLGLKGWQAAFVIVGLPGLLMALWVKTLKEPIRGASEGIRTPDHPKPFLQAWYEFTCVVPPFTVLGLQRAGAKEEDYMLNITAAMAVTIAAYTLVQLVGDPIQWIALGLGVYATITWIQCLRLKDPAAYAMIFQSKAMLFVLIGFPFFPFVTYSYAAFMPPYVMRAFDLTAGEISLYLGLGAAIGGWLGVTSAGYVSDILKERFAASRIYVAVLSSALAIPVGLGFLLSTNLVSVYILAFFANVLKSMWIGASYATVMDLVMPRMRASAMALFLLLLTLVGLALGPYTTGRLSDFFVESGASQADGLRNALMIVLISYPIGFAFLYFAAKHIKKDMETRIDRAQALGEPV